MTLSLGRLVVGGCVLVMLAGCGDGDDPEATPECPLIDAGEVSAAVGVDVRDDTVGTLRYRAGGIETVAEGDESTGEPTHETMPDVADLLPDGVDADCTFNRRDRKSFGMVSISRLEQPTSVDDFLAGRHLEALGIAQDIELTPVDGIGDSALRAPQPDGCALTVLGGDRAFLVRVLVDGDESDDNCRAVMTAVLAIVLLANAWGVQTT